MRFNVCLSCLIGLLLLISCNNNQSKFQIQGNALGTTYHVNYYSKDKQNLEPKFDSIFKVINQSLSTYLPESNISKLNRSIEVKVDTHFEKVFQTSKSVYQKTGGYFDPSIGIMVNAYGFGPRKYDLTITKQTIDSLMYFVGFDNFSLKNNLLKTNLNSFYLDFNAIAKGYTVDVLADFLTAENIQNYFVEIGGEVVARGRDLDNDKIWNFGIETPSEDNFNQDLSYAITLHNKALATSGNYRKFKIDSTSGQKYVHTINPKTGLSEKSDVLSASVIAKTCAIADAYATGFMAMGFENAKAVIEKNQISALLIYVDDDNTMKTFMTDDLVDLTTEL